jgi:hypothetical protein
VTLTIYNLVGQEIRHLPQRCMLLRADIRYGGMASTMEADQRQPAFITIAWVSHRCGDTPDGIVAITKSKGEARRAKKTRSLRAYSLRFTNQARIQI